ncbi:MAG: hypothetical protein JWP57_3772, partial [Spirosoma sp.]|nr:hypothetical protein [Spirosoma sp.]
MAERLELMGIYDNVYRHWSGPTHGIDIIQGKAGVTDEGSAEIFQIRHFGSVNDVAKWVLTLSLMMFEL